MRRRSTFEEQLDKYGYCINFTAGANSEVRRYVRIWTWLYPVRYLWKNARMRKEHGFFIHALFFAFCL